MTANVRIVVSTALCMSLVATCQASQLNSTWLQGSGNWGTAANWSPAATPNNSASSTYAVTIGSGGTDVVTADTGFTVDSLTLGSGSGSAALQSGAGAQKLQALGALTINTGGTLSLASGDTFSVGGSLVNSGTLSLSGQGTSLSIAGDISNFGNLNAADGAVLNVGGTLNSPSATLFGSGLQINGGTVNLTGGGAGVTDIPAWTYLNQAGTFNVVNGGVVSNALANLTRVAGSLTIADGQSLNLTSLTNSGGGAPGYHQGTLIDGNSTVTIGTLTNSGYFSVAPGSVANIGVLNNTGSLTINGAVNLTGGGIGITDIAHTINLAGSFNVLNNGTPTSALSALDNI